MSDAVLYESRDDIGVITLNRPDNRNSMTPELLAAFSAATAAARADGAARCVVITGKGGCFSAGADFKSIVQAPEGGDRPRTAAERSFAMYEPFLGVLDIEVPVIAACNGHTVGGGFGLSLMADLGASIGRATVTTRAQGPLLGQVSDEDLHQETRELREGVGRVRAIPQATIGMAYRF